MRLIDSQIHLWTDQAAASKMLQQAMSPEEIIAQMDTCGVLRTYLVPGHSGANELCVQAAKKWPDRFKALALLALDKQASRDIVAQWASSGFIGARLTFPPYREVSWLDDGTADWFWPLANELALPVMMWAPKRAATIGELAQRFARIRFIVDHINLFVMDKAEAVEREVSSVLQLAQLLHYPLTRPDFLSWQVRDLETAPPVLARHGLGLPVLAWTVRSAPDRALAQAGADQMIFEGFVPH